MHTFHPRRPVPHVKPHPNGPQPALIQPRPVRAPFLVQPTNVQPQHFRHALHGGRHVRVVHPTGQGRLVQPRQQLLQLLQRPGLKPHLQGFGRRLVAGGDPRRVLQRRCLGSIVAHVGFDVQHGRPVAQINPGQVEPSLLQVDAVQPAQGEANGVGAVGRPRGKQPDFFAPQQRWPYFGFEGAFDGRGFVDVGVAIKHKRDPDVAEQVQPFERRTRHVFAEVQPADGGGGEGALPWAAAAVDEEGAGDGDGGEGEGGETVVGGGGGRGGRLMVL